MMISLKGAPRVLTDNWGYVADLGLQRLPRGSIQELSQ